MQDENELAEKYREPLTRFKPNDVKVTRSRGSVIVPWCFPAADQHRLWCHIARSMRL